MNEINKYHKNYSSQKLNVVFRDRGSSIITLLHLITSFVRQNWNAFISYEHITYREYSTNRIYFYLNSNIFHTKYSSIFKCSFVQHRILYRIFQHQLLIKWERAFWNVYICYIHTHQLVISWSVGVCTCLTWNVMYGKME